MGYRFSAYDDLHYYGGSERHPGCPRGCGELADECACPPARRNPLGSMKISGDDYDYRPQCRWKNCRKESTDGIFCDIHFGTL